MHVLFIDSFVFLIKLQKWRLKACRKQKERGRDCKCERILVRAIGVTARFCSRSCSTNGKKKNQKRKKEKRIMTFGTRLRMCRIQFVLRGRKTRNVLSWLRERKKKKLGLLTWSLNLALGTFQWDEGEKD